MWPDLPIEFTVSGTPVSLQSANARAKDEWKAKVLAAARTVVSDAAWAFNETRLAVALFYFPQAPMTGDVDNIVKLVLDALKPHIYLDDQSIDRVVVQRFGQWGQFTFARPSEVLLSAMARTDPVLYIRIADAPLQDISP